MEYSSSYDVFFNNMNFNAVNSLSHTVIFDQLLPPPTTSFIVKKTAMKYVNILKYYNNGRLYPPSFVFDTSSV